jgi:hypothetical protein
MYIDVKKIETEKKTVEVSGRVVGETKSSFENVSIYSKDASKMWSTNGDGSFTIKMGPEDTIAFKFPIYQTLYMTLTPKR